MEYGTYLAHHGILGQKWGVRRFQNKDGSLTTAEKKRRSALESHEDYSKAHASKKVEHMSDAELRSVLNRLDMEKRYAQYGKSYLSTGKKFAQEVITNAAKQTATDFVAKYMKKGLNALFTSANS